jgi:hypothetical protein
VSKSLDKPISGLFYQLIFFRAQPVPTVSQVHSSAPDHLESRNGGSSVDKSSVTAHHMIDNSGVFQKLVGAACTVPDKALSKYMKMKWETVGKAAAVLAVA